MKRIARRRQSRQLLPALVLTLLAASGASAQERFHAALDPAEFPVPQTLVPNVEFWRNTFSTYESTQTVIHDDRHLDVVFSVVDVEDLVSREASAVAIERAQDDRVRREVRKYQDVLRRLARDKSAGGAEADRVRSLYARSARQATDYGAAASRVRGQTGLKDRFEEALQVSGMFMEGIEQSLARHGVPREVKCLPFVESMFNYRARSKVGASGAWQFTPGTGRLYLQMDAAVDARSDVWLAAEGAARMLSEHHASVQSWPLALTGYNHGIAGMRRAVRQVGTSDIGVVVDRYSSRTFGFASRNFYAEFVAAVTVFADRQALFPGVEPLPTLRFDELAPGKFVSLLDLAHLTETDTAELVSLNPALHDEVARGRLLVPATYPLRVPLGKRTEFQRALNQLPESRKRDRQLSVSYRVRRGDTLSAIARQFRTSVATLQRANGLPRANRIYVGQRLEVGVGSSDWTPLAWSPGASEVARGESLRVHIVRAGETLTQIARRYGLPVALLVAANDLSSPNRIQIGTQLSIPTTSTPPNAP